IKEKFAEATAAIGRVLFSEGHVRAAQAGARPLPKRFQDRSLVADVRDEAARLESGQEAGETRRIAGRVMARRGHGKLVFLDLVDRSGRIQLLCDTSRTGEID